MMSRRRTAAAGAIALATAVLCWPLYWNRFPFVYWDTLQYLTRFATRTPSLDRPIVYSIVVWFFSNIVGGLVMLAVIHAAVTAALLFTLVSACVTSRYRWVAFTLSVAAIALTPNTFHVVTIMPDVATLWLALALALLLVAKSMRLQLTAAAVVAFALLLHNSNLPIALLAFPLLVIAHRARLMIAAVIVWLVAMVAQNVWMGAAPLGTPTVFFIAARMNQNQALINGLASQKGPRYAAWSRQAAALIREPEPFLWSPESPLRRDFPRWDTNVAQFNAARSFLKPVVMWAIRHDRQDLIASTNHNIGSLASSEYLLLGYHVDRAALSSIAATLPEDVRWYLDSRQVRGDYPQPLLIWKRMSRVLCAGAAAIALAGVIALCANRRLPAGTKAAVVLAAVFTANLIVCGALSSPQTRYIERLFALPFIAVILGVSRP
jgi:hypothetical protein